MHLKKFLFVPTLLILIGLSIDSFALGEAGTDSQNLGPQNTVPIHNDSYILSTGFSNSYQTGGTVYASTHCDPGFFPTLHVNLQSTPDEGSCAIKQANINPGMCFTTDYGYFCEYSTTVSYSTDFCPDDVGIEVSYTLWCVKQ